MQRISLKGVPKSAEHREKLRQANLGKTASAETRAKQSQARKGRPVSDETKAKMSAAALGRPKSEQAKANMSAAKKGRPGRPLSETERLAIGQRFSRPWTEEQRAKRSGPNSPLWGRPPQHKPRVEYDGMKFRSTWEIRFAKRLNELGISWEYEKYRFDLDECTYTPEFYLPEHDVFWEVKGWLDPRSQRIATLFRSKFPEVSLVIATKPTLQLMRF